MNLNEQKGVAYDKLEDLRTLLNTKATEGLNDVVGAIPEEWEDTQMHIEAMQRHLKKLLDNIEFAVSTVENRH